MVHSPSRRDLLRSGAALTALTTLAGCSGLMDSLGEDGSAGPLATVPDGVTLALTVDAEAVRDDDATKTLVNAWFEGRAEGTARDDRPESYDDLLSRFEDDFGLDPTAVSSFAPFFNGGGFYGLGARGGAAVVTADWSAEDITDSLSDSMGNSYEEDEHYGQPIYHPETDSFYGAGIWLGVLGDGEYVVGWEGAVRETIEVSLGEVESLDGRMQEAHAATRDAPIRFVLDIPLGLVPDEIERDDTTVQLEPLNEVATVAGAVYRDGNTRGVEVTMAADDTATAENLVDTVEGYLAFAEQGTERETMAEALDEVTVSRDGSDVVLRYESTVDDLADTVRAFAEPRDDRRRRRDTPAVAFSFEYDESAGTVEITHDGGDTVRASELRIRGAGFADAAGADMTGGGRWRGSASGEIGDEPAVVAGDRVVVGVDGDYELAVVWEREDDGVSATLARDEGPKA
jgi:hypothetical protein